jgi:hypothetical protein
LANVLRRCANNPDRLYFVLLDEMNLAPIEHYLAELLSAMEEDRAGATGVQLPLYPDGVHLENEGEWPSSLDYPRNLVLIGTVNVDESTRPLSERVLDRANVIHLDVGIGRRHHRPPAEAPRPMVVPFTEWRHLCIMQPAVDEHDFLDAVAEELRRVGVGVGARAHVELERFLANARTTMDPGDALDFGILQRIIPKIRGFKRDLVPSTDVGLGPVHEMLRDRGCRRSARILEFWLDNSVSDSEFLDGTDPRLPLLGR